VTTMADLHRGSRDPEPLLSLRSTVVLMLAVLAGIGAGILSAVAGQPVPAAVLVGGGACSGALMMFHRLIGRR